MTRCLLSMGPGTSSRRGGPRAHRHEASAGGHECGVLNVKAIDKASDVGGTWYWNRYPGAMSDTHSYLYRYSWDHEDLLESPWNTQYLRGPDIRAYLRHIVERHKLRPYFQFDTEMLGADWSDSERRWTVTLSTGPILKVAYLITPLGLLSKTNFPNIPNIDKFAGDLYHTASWPSHPNLQGKRVGVIGNGSTGVQLITALAKSDELAQLLCFQRSPQYTVPAGNGPNYPEIWNEVKDSLFGFGIGETTRKTSSVSPAEREMIYEDAWQKGNGFRFMFETFSDVSVDEEANLLASEFIKSKIRSIVKDPARASKLCPREWYARRPLCDSGYYEQFNRPNVDIIDIHSNPIAEFVPQGIKTADGTVYDLDVVICATGFDAVDGNYTRMAIKGRGGQTLKEHWKKTGPTSFLGLCVSDFPNLFMVLGPNGPFSNQTPAIEAQVEFICELIAKAEEAAGSGTNGLSPPRENGTTGLKFTNSATNGDSHSDGHGARSADNSIKCHGMIEATQEAEDTWTQYCDELSASSLFRRVDSWIFGKNIPGKKVATMFYFGGLGPYRKEVRERIEDGMKGWVVS